MRGWKAETHTSAATRTVDCRVLQGGCRGGRLAFVGMGRKCNRDTNLYTRVFEQVNEICLGGFAQIKVGLGAHRHRGIRYKAWDTLKPKECNEPWVGRV